MIMPILKIDGKKTVKMGANSAKSCFAVDRGCKFVLFMDYI